MITSGNITDIAKTRIRNGLERPYQNITQFWNGERVLAELRDLDNETIEYSEWDRRLNELGLFDLLKDDNLQLH